MKNVNKTLMVLSGVCLLAATSANADVVMFDDAASNGWSQEWYTDSQTTHVYEGTTALETENGQLALSHAGFVDANNYIVEFYANTKDTTPTEDLFIKLMWTDADTTAHDVPFDNRNVPVVYMIDGIPVSAGTSDEGIALDTDTSTWQKIQLDLTQTAYTDFDPYVAHNYVPGSSTLTRITFRSDGGQSSNVVLDNVRLVPEPASLALLGLGAATMISRRRRA